MKVELLIADDHELRAAVRELIKAEVVAIARSELRSILAEVTSEKVMPKTAEDMERIVREEVRDIVEKALSGTDFWGPDGMLRRVARDEINRVIREAAREGKLI